ncbi:EAL domain-containing protein [Undibacterium sp.]|jgi:EAL domain-containing protein (putative c-di-GMP-specific phosphodiesterase class I)|uniref:EAL domain-containing protein n=1 Tax=Undibacterium sp. TaxID=1914977 RepID=UPI002C608A97|nr:EAL domain-containing protein [Undibacterium sp.]HTD04293.1 EAL domain-containing protein [Undibacterium sp.]
MPSPALQKYLTHLYSTQGASTNIWLDAEGRARGRYFNSTLTSAFQPIRSSVSRGIIGYEGYARSYAVNDQGLNVWKLLDHAANDNESIELDRLCRILHAINFYRQPESHGMDLYLTVHTRLLAAVEGNHGMAFRRILDILELPHRHIVLQLPPITPSQRWVLNHVADNYRRNGFRIGINAGDAHQALDLLERVRPNVVKLNANGAIALEAHCSLLEQADRAGSRVVFKHIENEDRLQALLKSHTAAEYFLQGYLLDLPAAGLVAKQAKTLERAETQTQAV